MSFLLLPPSVGLFLDLSGHNYQLTFLMGFGIAIVSLIPLFVVYRKFLGLGGDKNYVAP